ncbi:MAG: cyclase family protein [Christensenellales bacterium]
MIDITRKLTEGIYVYPGDPIFTEKEVFSFSKGDPYTVTKLSLGTHTGTHIDAPAHFIKNGRKISSYKLDDLCGKAKVFEIREAEIKKSDLEKSEIECGDIILFKTANSIFDGKIPLKNPAYISESAAKYLVSKKIKLVGIDYITVDNEASFTSHLIFLNSEIPILENIDLSSVRPGKYRLYCFPLNTDTEAAPVRVALEVI